MDAVVWLTYDEIATWLGIERESARQQVKRKRWARQNGNDGKVRIAVPEEVLSTDLNLVLKEGRTRVKSRDRLRGRSRRQTQA